MDWFLHDTDVRQEGVKKIIICAVTRCTDSKKSARKICMKFWILFQIATDFIVNLDKFHTSLTSFLIFNTLSTEPWEAVQPSESNETQRKHHNLPMFGR